jgi:N-acetylglucosaminyldiphosphoundecaprenol N-acetyl-beta-D-mannosaminyltransferase
LSADFTVYIKSLFLAWLWLETSSFLFKKRIKIPFLKRLYEQGTLNCIVLYGILVSFVQVPEIRNLFHSLFLPFLTADILVRRQGPKPQLYFWLEVVTISLLIHFGLKIAFISNPEGGFYFFNRSVFYVTFFWMIFVVSLINLCNFLDGLLVGISCVLAHTFLISIILQPTVNQGSLPFALVLSSFTLLNWLFFILKESKGLNTPVLSSTIALLVGILSILSTSKKIALISISIPLGIFIIPIVFFGFIIFYTHFQYKMGKKEFAEQTHYQWRFSTISVNAFVLLATVTVNFIVLVVAMVQSKLWATALALFAMVMFTRLAKLVFIKDQVHYRDITFPHQDHILLFGTRIFRNEKQRAVELADRVLSSAQDRLMHLVTPDALCLFRTLQDKKFGSILEKAWMAIPDGAGVLWASIFLKERPLLERIPGIDFTKELLKHSEKKGYTVYFLGAKEATLKAAIEILKTEFPKVNFIGSHHGYFTEEEEPQLINSINDLKPDILFVALGVPSQEYFIDKFRHRLKVKIAVGIGGSLDVISGHLKRSPKFFQEYGLEWLYRTLKEPWRISRIYALPLFIVMVLKEKLKLGDYEKHLFEHNPPCERLQIPKISSSSIEKLSDF